jgi:hypothetical protein
MGLELRMYMNVYTLQAASTIHGYIRPTQLIAKEWRMSPKAPYKDKLN